MTPRARLAAALGVAALAACGSSSSSSAGALLAEPSSVAVFRGVTPDSGFEPANPVHPYRPFLAIANAASNDLTIVDATDDTLIASPALTRGLVYSVPGRPVLLAGADLGDRHPDLLVVVTAGDLPWLGGTQLRVVRTWAADGKIVDRSDGAPAVELGGDVLALHALPFDPAAPGRVTLVAALAGERVATVTFSRAAGTTKIDVDAAQATVRTSAPLGFQPLALASLAGERHRVFAASADVLPGGVQGVAQLDLAADGTPSFGAALNARAPTRLVAAAHLAAGEALFDPALDATAFEGPASAPRTPAAVDRVVAVLDESGCGLHASIACGLVAIDPATRDLALDPTPAGSMNQGFRAPIPAGYALALGASGPPAVPPSAAEPQYAGTYMRVAMPGTTWTTTGVAGVVSADGALTWVDLGRWNVPSGHSVLANVKATVASTRPAGTSGPLLSLVDPSSGATVVSTDPAVLGRAVTVTGGYTPTDRWTVVREGALPGLTLRRAEAYPDGSLALQASSGGAVQEVVRVWDPTLGVSTGDVVVIEPTGLGTCTRFEARVEAVVGPTPAAAGIPARPGGHLVLGHRTPAVAAWDRCVDAMRTATGATYLATVRAGGYVLVRGAGAAAVHVGRPEVGERFEVAWQDEAPLAAACPLPPSVRWQAGWSVAPPACDDACRAGCALLQRVRLARRIGYVSEAPAGLTGPALAFTLALSSPGASVPRDLALVIDTADGRAPYRVGPTTGSGVDARQVVIFDRSPWVAAAGQRFLVPYLGGVLNDATPSLGTGAVFTLR